MINKLIISQYQNKITSILFSDNLPIEIRVEDNSCGLQVGDIYIGRIKDLPKGISGAFADVNGEICYYPLNELDSAIYTHKQSDKPVVCGDEIIFQIQREAIKTKAVGLTTKIALSERYLVYEPCSARNSISSRINEPARSTFKKLFSEFPDKGFIIRTAASTADQEEIVKEAFNLKEKYDNIIKAAKGSAAGTCLYKAFPAYVDLLQHTGGYSPDAIITDIPRIYDEAVSYARDNDIKVSCELYQDKKLKLNNLYNFDRIITECFHERVWLKSGGYLVIQHTEALTVIDVNTGKASNDRSSTLFREINMEAALQIPSELRLRNISGIILVDFINLENRAELQNVCRVLETELNKDPVSTKYIDTTSLQLVEIVREKKRRPVIEYFKD